MVKQTLPSANINTPEELLDNAERHYLSTDLNAMRAAVLEAMAALETYVTQKVFPALSGKLDPDFVKWLEKKTLMDFDSRLSDLAAFALGRRIDKNNTLWKDYKKVRGIRNKVVHGGARVSRQEGRFVLDTVYNWLAFLGSSVGVQAALLGLKNHIQKHPSLTITSEQEAVDLIVKYFSKSKASEVVSEGFLSGSRSRPDVVLKIGQFSVIIEAKFSKERIIGPFVTDITNELARIRDEYGAEVGAAIIFHKGEPDPMIRNIIVLQEGRLYILMIPV